MDSDPREVTGTAVPDPVRSADPVVAEALAGELDRQRDTLAMIASENHASPAVLAAQGSVLTNKYAEGYPGERYYGGCEFVDDIEQLAIDRAKALWGAEHANVQPHSGTQANMAVYFAVLEAGDRILSLDLTNGGHLSHGHPANFSGELYDVEHYHVDPETGFVDYEELEAAAEAHAPDVIVSGYSAYPRAVDWERVQAAAEAVDAYHLADMAHVTGLVAGGVLDSPVGVADFVTGSTHKTIRAGRGGLVLCGETHADDIDRAVMPGMQGGPLEHNIAGKAVGFGEALDPAFDRYAEQVVANARALADVLEDRGFHLVSGGTDTHLVLVDLRPSHPDTTGKTVERALEDVGIVLNANTVPDESRSPFVASGFRAGTAALTTRGFEEAACARVGEVIADVVDAPDDAGVKAAAADVVDGLCSANPLYD